MTQRTFQSRRRPLRECERLESRLCPAATLLLQGPTSVLLEGERADFTLTLSDVSPKAETVFVTTRPGTATYGADYFAPQSTQITFTPGQRTKTFSIATLRDAGTPITEGVETFSVIVTPANPSLGTRTAGVSIIDYVAPPDISIADVRLAEGNSGTSTMTFTVSLSTAFPKPVSVSYTTRDGSARTADSDYVAAAGTLNFAPGETRKTIGVTINGDTNLETDETFSLILSAATNGRISRGTAIGTITNDETDKPGFQITVQYLTSFYGEVPPSVRTAMQVAVQRWEKVITGDVPGYFEVSTGLFVDDFRMRVQMGLLGGGGSDGGGGVLANATPVQYRIGGTGLPWLGDTGIDPADVTNPQLVGILTHEIGHALGFAPGNVIFDRWVSGFTWTGPNALREYKTLAGGSMTSVPLESGGGGGTVGAHWSETTFDTELMTGYAEAGGVPMPLSRITVGAFADLGYTVNYAAADAYALPPPIVPPVTAPSSPPIRLPNPIVRPASTVIRSTPTTTPPVVSSSRSPRTGFGTPVAFAQPLRSGPAAGAKSVATSPPSLASIADTAFAGLGQASPR